jgi:hypothetical protein
MEAARMSHEQAMTKTSSALPPLPRRKLGPLAVTLLIGLRVYVIVAIPIVAYAFIKALLAAHH